MNPNIRLSRFDCVVLRMALEHMLMDLRQTQDNLPLAQYNAHQRDMMNLELSAEAMLRWLPPTDELVTAEDRVSTASVSGGLPKH